MAPERPAESISNDQSAGPGGTHPNLKMPPGRKSGSTAAVEAMEKDRPCGLSTESEQQLLRRRDRKDVGPRSEPPLRRKRQTDKGLGKGIVVFPTASSSIEMTTPG